jgi:hypothetical protein
VLLSRKGGTHFEEATRVNDSGGFPYDRHGHGRQPIESPQDHDESQIHGDSSRRQVDRKVGTQDGCQDGCQDGIQEKQDEPHESQTDPETGSETHQEADAQTHQETDSETHQEADAQTHQEIDNPSLFDTQSAAKAALFFKSRPLSDERSAG